MSILKSTELVQYTETLTTHFNKDDVKLNRKLISQFVGLSKDGIQRIKYGKVDRYINGFFDDKKRKKKKDDANSKKKNLFENQCTIILNIGGNIVNCKLFQNSSVQIAGAKTRENKDIVEKIRNFLFDIFNTYIIDKRNGKMFSFVDFPEKLGKFPFRSEMNNFIFNVGININRFNLCSILKKERNIISADFNPQRYVGITAKLKTKRDNVISLLIFRTGNIILSFRCESDGNGSDKLTGDETFEEVQAGRQYIIDLIEENIREVESTDIDSIKIRFIAQDFRKRHIVREGKQYDRLVIYVLK